MLQIVLKVLIGGADGLRYAGPSHLSVATSLATSFQPGEGGLPGPQVVL